MTHVEDDFYVRLGERIRVARKRQGSTQEDVAFRLGLNRTTFVNIEKGRQRLAVHQLVDLAHALGREPSELLPGPTVDSGPAEERKEFLALVQSEPPVPRSQV